MRKNRLYLYSLFGGLVCILFTLPAFITVRNATKDKASSRLCNTTGGFHSA